MTDLSALQDALEQDTSYAAGLSKSMALVLEVVARDVLAA